MADTKISALAAVTSLISTDEFVLARSGTTKKITTASLGLSDGWTPAGETWTYASADAPTFTFTVAADVTAKYQAGMKVKLNQTTDKYFVITAVSTFSGGNTTITIYGGTDYTLANAAISSPYWSMLKAPFGFPTSPAKWTETLTDSSRRDASGTTTATWFNAGSLSIQIPIGVWDVSYHAMALSVRGTGTTMSTRVTLSTANNTESDPDLGIYAYVGSTITDLAVYGGRRKTLTLASKTQYFVNIWGGAASLTLLTMLNDFTPLRVNAVCAYL